jgi:IS5 family transposase
MAWPTKLWQTRFTTVRPSRALPALIWPPRACPPPPRGWKFRRRRETHDLCQGLFAAINTDLTACGLRLRAGTLVDATLIAAQPSTKNQEQQRDPERHQTRKGNPWYFGMKAHIGADRDSQLVHPVVVTAGNVADLTQTAERLHGQEQQVHADAGYTGVKKRAEIVALERKIDWQMARKRGPLKTMATGAEKATLKAVEQAKASVRAFVEHPCHILKNIFREQWGEHPINERHQEFWHAEAKPC